MNLECECEWTVHVCSCVVQQRDDMFVWVCSVVVMSAMPAREKQPSFMYEMRISLGVWCSAENAQ